MNVDRPFDVLSLCSGNGIGDIALRLAIPGARTRVYVEREAHAIAALARSMESGALAPGGRIWTDLRTFDPRPFAGCLDCIVATYPCQPFSDAGLRLGENDPRHLWPVIREIVRITNPALVFIENVRGHLRRGFRSVCHDLQRLGYRIKAGLWSAEEMGSPQGRVRLFALAYAQNHNRWPGIAAQETGIGQDEVGGQRSGIGCGGLGPAWRPPELAVAAGAGPSRWQDRTGDGGEALRVASVERGSSQLANAGSDGWRERSPEDDDDWRDASRHQPDGCDPRVLYFPPHRTGDWQRWNDVLVRAPWLRPSIASAEAEHLLFGMADGLAHQLEFRRNRVDRIRAVGNGVCPIAMAVAFCLLCEAHGIGRIEPDGFVLTEGF